MSNMKIGWSEISITPDKKVSLYGQFAERISEYVEKPLTVTAFAVECGGEQAVIVSCDLAETGMKLVRAVREKLKDNTVGLDPEKVLLCAIHTHTGFDPCSAWFTEETDGLFKSLQKILLDELGGGYTYVETAAAADNTEVATSEECFAILTEKIPQAVLEAWNSRKPGSFANAFERAPVGMCRRVDYSDGTAQMWGDSNTAVFTELEGGNDSGVEMLFCFGENREVTGVVLNVACPAQCVQHRNFVSPDYWGETKKLLRERFGDGIFVLPLCGAAGDQCPVDLVRWVNPETEVNDPNIIRHNPVVRKADPSMFDLSGMRKAGKRVADAVSTAWEEGVGALQADVPLIHHVHRMEIPLRRATLADAAEARNGIRAYFRGKEKTINYIDLANVQKYLGVLQRMEVQEKFETVEAEVHIIRLGSIAIATSPFELYLAFGNQIRARAACEQTFLVQLCCGSEGYLPTEKAEKHGHYSAFIASCQCGHEGGDLLVRQTLKDLNAMFD